MTRPAAAPKQPTTPPVRLARLVRISKGVDVPYPEPTSPTATKIAKANRRSDTRIEVALRSTMHRRGLRFRKDHLVRAGGQRARVDICFPRAKVAVFVDGCFWHLCPQHARVPRTNVAYWMPKLEANVARDRRIDTAFISDGWTVLHVWEHDTTTGAADRVQAAVEARTAGQ